MIRRLSALMAGGFAIRLNFLRSKFVPGGMVSEGKSATTVLVAGLSRRLTQALSSGGRFEVVPVESARQISFGQSSRSMKTGRKRILCVDLDQAPEELIGWLRQSHGQKPDGVPPLLAMTESKTCDTWRQEDFTRSAFFLLQPLTIEQLKLGIEQALAWHRLRENLRRAQDPPEQKAVVQADPAQPGLDTASESALEVQWRDELHQAEGLESLVRQIIEIAARQCRAGRASLMLYNRDTGALEIRHATGLDPSIVKKTRVQIGDGPAGYVAQTRKPLLVRDSLDFIVSNWEQRRQGPPSFASVPLMSGSRLIGVLNVSEKQDGQLFHEEELKQLSRLARVASEAIDQRQLLDGLSMGYLETLKVLARAIEHRDPYTSSHSERVCEYSLAIGRQLNLSTNELRTLESAAMLHDIGKVGIPPSILYKPSALDAEENRTLQEHPRIGASLLASLPHFEPIRRVAAHHHEWYNGQGYPDGLRGDQMSLLTRIVAVADVFDAITSDRPYRSGIEPETALEEIMSLSGNQFDPTVAEAFSRVMSECLETLQSKEIDSTTLSASGSDNARSE